jgi:hypothetical protein
MSVTNSLSCVYVSFLDLESRTSVDLWQKNVERCVMCCVCLRGMSMFLFAKEFLLLAAERFATQKKVSLERDFQIQNGRYSQSIELMTHLRRPSPPPRIIDFTSPRQIPLR